MPERFIRRQSLFRVKGLTKGRWVQNEARVQKADDHEAYQSFVEEIDRFYRGLREQRGEWPPLPNGQRSDVIAGTAGRNAIEFLQSRSADDVEDEI